MPTIDQLAPATASSDTDELIASQNGIAVKVTRGQVVAGLQPALAIPSGTVLGRQSSGVGVPEVLTIGANLVLNSGTLSATTGYTVSSLPAGTVPAAGDLVAMGQGGTNTAVPYSQFISGLSAVPGVDVSRMVITPTGSTTTQDLADFAAGVLAKSGGTMTGALSLVSDPTSALQAATKKYVDALGTASLSLAGGTMTGALTLAADPTTGLQAATKEYVDAQLGTALRTTGGTMTGMLTLSADPVVSSQAATKHYVDSQVATAVPLAGGTMAGALVLAGDPTAALQAATKHYVDTSSAAGLPASGGTLTGPLILASDPTVPLQAATKEYVDTQASAALPKAGGTMTGMLALASDPVASSQAATKHYVDQQVLTSLPIAGGTMTGSLLLATDPTASLQAATKHYVDMADALVLPLAGGILTGPLTLAADPTTSLQAATKHYVDVSTASAVSLSGGTMTGPLLLSANPSVAFQAATKQYVDTQVGGALPLAGGTLTGALTLAAAPTGSLQAATKSYVDSQVATALPLSGGTLAGNLTTLATGVPVAVGDNAPVLNFLGGRVNLLRQIVAADTNLPNMVIQLDNFSPMPLQSYGLYPQVGALSIQANGHSGGTASLDGLIVTLNLFGNNPYAAQDVAIQSTINQYGSDSSWLFDGFSRDLSGKPPQAFSQVGIELDMSANGPDAVTASYDSLHTYRVFLSLVPGLVTWPTWTAGTAYTTGTIVMANSAIWIVTTAGTSGTTSPAFTGTGTYTDGSVVWTYSEPYPVVFGRGIWLDSGYGGGARGTSISYGSGFASNALFQNAPIDISEATLASSASAGIRLAANMPIDFSGNGTQSQQNIRTLGYYSSVGALVYTAGTTAVFEATNAGRFLAPGVLQAAFGSAGSLSGVTAGYQGGLTVGTNYSGTGETDFMVGTGGFSLYAIQSTGAPASSPLMSSDGSGNLTGFGNLSIAGVVHLATASGSKGNLNGVASGYPNGITIGADYAGVGEVDLMIGGGGFRIYGTSSGVPNSSPLVNSDGSGNFYALSSMTTSGAVSGSTLAVGGKQVVGPQIAGWGTSSNGTRGSINGSTATLSQVSTALAQLLIDLKTHGLLGN